MTAISCCVRAGCLESPLVETTRGQIAIAQSGMTSNTQPGTRDCCAPLWHIDATTAMPTRPLESSRSGICYVFDRSLCTRTWLLCETCYFTQYGYKLDRKRYLANRLSPR